jgi:predicted 2-oxoglutarate/Fe(II)-dependent dioxygenase YbiX
VSVSPGIGSGCRERQAAEVVDADRIVVMAPPGPNRAVHAVEEDRMQITRHAGIDLFTLADFLTPDECADFVARSEAAGYEEAPITTRSGPVMRKDVRDNARLIRDDPALAADWFAGAEASLPAEWFHWRLAGLNERFRFYRYDVGQHFAPHTDGYFERENGERSHLTFLVYLNDDFTGGETVFWGEKPPLRVRPVRGMALVFSHRRLHEGATVAAGRKYVLRTDVMYR